MPLMIAPAIADALGLGEHQGRSAADNVLELAGRAGRRCSCWTTASTCWTAWWSCWNGCSPAVRGWRVLATSRARLLVPFEWVFLVPGLSVEADDGGPGDAVELFLGAGGSRRESADVRRQEAHRRRLPGPRWHGAGDRAGRRPVPVARARWARSWAGRPAAAADRRPADRRPASFAALDARLELRAAGRTRSGGAAPGLGFRRPVHRYRGGGGAGRLAAGAGRRCSRPSWPGSPTRAC